MANKLMIVCSQSLLGLRFVSQRTSHTITSQMLPILQANRYPKLKENWSPEPINRMSNRLLTADPLRFKTISGLSAHTHPQKF
jgi:hypothetical protein